MSESKQEAQDPAEMKALRTFLDAYPIDTAYVYAQTAAQLEFLEGFLSRLDDVPEPALRYIVAALTFEESGLRDRAKRVVNRMFTRHHKMLREHLLAAWASATMPEAKAALDDLLSRCFSPLYFDYSSLNESPEEPDPSREA